MTNLPIKSESKKIQKRHLRRYKTGKITLVNKEVIRPSPQNAPKTQYKPEYKTSINQTQQNTQTPKVVLRPKERPKEALNNKKVDEFAENMAATIMFPIITFPGQEDTFPKPLKDQLQMLRMLQLMKDEKDFKENALDEEVLGYLSTASLVAPLD